MAVSFATKLYLKQVTQNVKICMNSVFADRLSWSLGKAQSDLELVMLLSSGVAGITGHHPSLGVNFFAVCCWHLVGCAPVPGGITLRGSVLYCQRF